MHRMCQADRWFAMTRLDENRAAASWPPKQTVRYPRFPMSRFGEIILLPSILIITTPKLAVLPHLKSLRMIHGLMWISFPPFSNGVPRLFRHAVHPQLHLPLTRRLIPLYLSLHLPLREIGTAYVWHPTIVMVPRRG